MRPTDKLKEKIRKVEFKTDGRLREKVLGEALKEFESGKVAFKERQVRRIRVGKMVKFAAAAVVVAALFVVIEQFGGFSEASMTWADTVERIYKATSVTFTRTLYIEDNEPFSTFEMVNSEGIKRSRLFGIDTIWDFGSGKKLRLEPENKEATLTYRIGRKRAAKPYNQMEWFISIKDKAEEYLGVEDVNGVPAEKFIWRNGEYNYTTVWIDPSTNLPVKVRRVSIPNPDDSIEQPSISLGISDFGGIDNGVRSISMGGGKGIQKKTVVVLTDFKWNKKLDPELFSLEPPADYSLKEKQFDVSFVSENDLVEAFSFWTEMSGGEFPERMNDLIDPNKIDPMLIEKYDGGGDPEQELEAAMQKANIILKGVFFAFNKKTEQEWYYRGGGVYLGDSDLIVCGWKKEDNDKYRVIYGDLSLGQVPFEELPR